MYRRPKAALCLPNNQVQDFLSEGDYDSAGQGQDPVCSLGRIVRLEGHTHLHDTESQEDEADCSNQAENES